jgi:hypothetical protein
MHDPIRVQSLLSFAHSVIDLIRLAHYLRSIGNECYLNRSPHLFRHALGSHVAGGFSPKTKQLLKYKHFPFLRVNTLIKKAEGYVWLLPQIGSLYIGEKQACFEVL